MRTLLVLLATLTAAGALRASTAPSDLLSSNFRIIVDTEMTAEGKRWRSPTPSAPIFYEAISIGARDLGAIVGGERYPEKDQVYHLVGRALAKRGFLPARPGSPSEIVVLISWGTLLAERSQSGERITNQGQIRAFLGGGKASGFSDDFDPAGLSAPLAWGLRSQGATSDLIDDFAEQGLFMIVLSAYGRLAEGQARPTKLWSTRIGAPSRSGWLVDVFPAMIAMATPHLARAADGPVAVSAGEHFRPEVILGTPEYLETVDAPPEPRSP